MKKLVQFWVLHSRGRKHIMHVELSFKIERKNQTGFIHMLRNWIHRHFHTRAAGLTALAFTKSWKLLAIWFSPEECKDNACNVCTGNCNKMRRNFVTKCALSQNAQKFCYEMRVVTKCAEILFRNARCYKMRRNFVTKCALLQNAQLLQNVP